MYEQVSTPSSDELQAYVRGVEVCGPDARIDPLPFAEGAHNVVYLGDTGPDSEKFVLRHPKHPAHGAMLHKEARALKLVGDLAPQVLHCGRLASGVSVLVQKYIPGESKRFGQLDSSEVSRLATTFSAVHAITSDRFSGRSGEEPNCCEGTYEDYLWAMIHESVNVRLSRFDLEPYPEAIELLEKGMRLQRNLIDRQAGDFRAPNRPFSLQQHDGNEDNVLWLADGTPKLIDWNATFGDPADELAYIFTDNHCGPAFVKIFLQSYQPPEGSGDVIARIPAYVLKNMLDDLAWTIEMRELHPSKDQWVAAYQQRLANMSSYLQEAAA